MIKEILVRELPDVTSKDLLEYNEVEAIYYGEPIESESLYCYLVKFKGSPELFDYSHEMLTDEMDMFINAIIDLGYGEKLSKDSEVYNRIFDYIGLDAEEYVQ
jgi:hypothetical protein